MPYKYSLCNGFFYFSVLAGSGIQQEWDLLMSLPSRPKWDQEYKEEREAKQNRQVYFTTLVQLRTNLIIFPGYYLKINHSNPLLFLLLNLKGAFKSSSEWHPPVTYCHYSYCILEHLIIFATIPLFTWFCVAKWSDK